MALSMYWVVAAQPEPYEKAFEPYRQCVLVQAQKGYSSSSNLKAIFSSAEEACAEEAQQTLGRLAAAAAAWADDKPITAENPLYSAQDRFNFFERNLLFELAEDFKPKAK
ncbi:hypothetical protein [Sphingomonas sp. KC8]|uniref:hypothetical protein n=1 Tax=Sphingomonas sp. KC8 TaxID=1030157 RepID=UPI001303D3DE|nr:hypothetical protein [Sphingomonas sp. KC8]